MVQHKAPHRDWSPAPKYLDAFSDVTFPEPDTLFDTYEKFFGSKKTRYDNSKYDVAWLDSRLRHLIQIDLLV